MAGRASPWDLTVWLGGRSRALLRSARFWIVFLLLLIVVLVVYYALSDKYTPFTRDVYVQAYVIQVRTAHRRRSGPGGGRGESAGREGGPALCHRPPALSAPGEDAGSPAGLGHPAGGQLKSEQQAEQSEEVRLAAEESYAKTVYDQEKRIYADDATTQRPSSSRAEVQGRPGGPVALKAMVRQKEEALAAQLDGVHALVAEVQAQLATACSTWNRRA